MSLRIIKGTDAIPVDHPVFVIFGQPGISKSSLGYSALDPLTLDFDRGSHRAANRRDTLVLDAWADVEELMHADAVATTLAPYQTIVIDTVGRCLDYLALHLIAENPKHSRGAGELSLQGFGALKARFRGWMHALRALGKDVVLIAHHKEEKAGDTLIVRPDITGGSYDEVMKIADFVGYVYMLGKHRVIDFNPTDAWVGKNPAGWAPMRIPPVEKATDFLAKLIPQGRAALGRISEESARVLQQVESWRATIGGLETPAQINAAIADAQPLAPVLAPQVKKLIAERAKALGFTWNAGTRAFVAPTPVATPTTAPAVDDIDFALQSSSQG